MFSKLAVLLPSTAYIYVPEKASSDTKVILSKWPGTQKLYQYLVYSLDRNRLQKIKEVTYDKDTGIIESIPSLVFNSKTSKFTLKRNDKRNSTLLSLSNGSNTTRKRIIKSKD